MNKLTQLFSKKPYLAWYVKDTKNMSVESMLEHILNYGDWDDYQLAEKALGIEKTKSIFDKLKNKTRRNLGAKTINYFEQYFQMYA